MPVDDTPFHRAKAFALKRKWIAYPVLGFVVLASGAAGINSIFNVWPFSSTPPTDADKAELAALDAQRRLGEAKLQEPIGLLSQGTDALVMIMSAYSGEAGREPLIDQLRFYWPQRVDEAVDLPEREADSLMEVGRFEDAKQAYIAAHSGLRDLQAQFVTPKGWLLAARGVIEAIDNEPTYGSNRRMFAYATLARTAIELGDDEYASELFATTAVHDTMDQTQFLGPFQSIMAVTDGMSPELFTRGIRLFLPWRDTLSSPNTPLLVVAFAVAESSIDQLPGIVRDLSGARERFDAALMSAALLAVDGRRRQASAWLERANNLIKEVAEERRVAKERSLRRYDSDRLTEDQIQAAAAQAGVIARVECQVELGIVFTSLQNWAMVEAIRNGATQNLQSIVSLDSFLIGQQEGNISRIDRELVRERLRHGDFEEAIEIAHRNPKELMPRVAAGIARVDPIRAEALVDQFELSDTQSRLARTTPLLTAAAAHSRHGRSTEAARLWEKARASIPRDDGPVPARGNYDPVQSRLVETASLLYQADLVEEAESMEAKAVARRNEQEATPMDSKTKDAFEIFSDPAKELLGIRGDAALPSVQWIQVLHQERIACWVRTGRWESISRFWATADPELRVHASLAIARGLAALGDG